MVSKHKTIFYWLKENPVYLNKTQYMYHKKWKQKLLTKQRKTHTPIQNFTIPHKTERVTVGHVFPEYAIYWGSSGS